MKNLLFWTVLVVFQLTNVAWGNLLINPTRVTLNPGVRSAEITLINTSAVTNTYRLGWSEKIAKVGGGYENLSEEQAKNFPTSSAMLRFTPRSVTLKPNERQTVKLALRRPAGLAAGEYRSHLVFKAVPPEKNVGGAEEGQAMAINIVLSFAIPVVVRQGELDYNIKAERVELAYNTTTKVPAVKLFINRSGSSSIIGNLSAYWTPEKGKEQLIAKVNELSLWPELSNTYIEMNHVGTDFALSSGKLRIVYEGIKDFKGETLINQTINVSKGDIIILN